MNLYTISWNRSHMTRRMIQSIRQTTDLRIIVADNGSKDTCVQELLKMRSEGLIDELWLLGKNYGVSVPKALFQVHAKAVQEPLYFVNDNDVMAPGVDWVGPMVAVMNTYDNLAFLAAQLPPQSFQGPYGVTEQFVLCKAVGNTLKLVKTDLFPEGFTGSEGYGDDTRVCALAMDMGHYTGYMKDIWCLHEGQCDSWGYEPDEIAADPRKANYGEPFIYEYDPKTFKPTDPRWRPHDDQ